VTIGKSRVPHFPSSSRTSERSERDPGPIATDARFAKAGAAAHSNNCHRWLWVPAFAGTTSGVCCASRFAKAGPFFLHERLRLKSNLLSRIKLFLPVQSRAKKYSASRLCKSAAFLPPSTPLQGRIAIVTDAGLDAMDAAALLTNSANADGEVVWS
jgi:hypothetical protein